MSNNDREHLSAFLTGIDASPIALERPVCRDWVGDYQITGKHGHVLTEGAGYLLFVTGTVDPLSLPGVVLEQNGNGPFIPNI